MINKAILLGNVGKDPESKETKNGFKMVTFSVATTSKKKVNDEWQDETEWHNIATFGKLADVVERYVVKGMRVYIEGRIKTDKFDDKQGVTRYFTKVIANEIKFLSKVEKLEQTEIPLAPEAQPATEPATTFDDDDIPF